MLAEWITLAVVALAGLAEWLHVRRCRRLARLAFGPSGQPREWTQFVPAMKIVAMGLLAWGLVTLLLVNPRSAKPQKIPEGGYRHLIVALDVSPSMTLKDSGAEGTQTRTKRASEVLMSVLERIALDQIRVSVVAFYTSAKPVVIDTFDIEVVKNILDELPLEMAFDHGKTSLIEGIREAATLARPWQPESTTLIIASDGDTVPDTGLPELPRAINQVIILGVGDAVSGKFIDGHQSRQDVSTLRQTATRLRGSYFDVNSKHLPSKQLSELAKILPMKDAVARDRRDYALAATGVGAIILGMLPLALAFFGAAWQTARNQSKSVFTSSGGVRAEAEAVSSRQ